MACSNCGCEQRHTVTKLDYEKLAEELNKVELNFSGLVFDRSYPEGNAEFWFTQDEEGEWTPYYVQQDEHGEWSVKEDGHG